MAGVGAEHAKTVNIKAGDVKVELGFRSQAAIDAEEKSELERAERVRKLSERPEKREKVDGAEMSPRTVITGGDESANVRVSTPKLQPPPVSHSGK